MSAGIRFGAFELDLVARELRKRGIRLRVPDQSVEILTVLLERPGEVISREEIRDRLWPNGTIVDFEHGVNSAMARLRQALGDCASTPRFIETLPRRGYRFVPLELAIGDSVEGTRFRILGEAGRGAMGVVYRAEDLRLGRTVALKFLPAELGSHPTALERLRGEARIAASLNHPRICTLFGLDEHAGQPCLVMEYLDGQPLSRILSSGPLPAKRAVEIAIQVAEALEAAHACGIVHADIKPSNLFVSSDWQVKVTDFGIARPAGASSTQPAGTPGYLSPEQVRGKALDGRSDLYSLGVVLRDMVTRSSGPDGLPKAQLHQFEHITAQCLQHDPEERFRNASELKIALESLVRTLEPEPATIAGRKPSRIRLGRLQAAAVLAFLLATGLAGIWQFLGVRSSRREITIEAVTRDAGLTSDPAISPDGKMIVYASDRAGNGDLDLWIQRLAGSLPTRITDDPIDEHEPCFSPDGTRIAFRAEKDGGGIYVTPATGGVPKRLAPRGRGPQFSPDGRWIAYWAGVGSGDFGGRAYVLPVAGGAPREIFSELEKAAMPVWSADGRSVAAVAPSGSRTEIWVASFDSEKGVAGGPHPIGFGQLKTTTLLAATWPTPARWMPGDRSIVFGALGSGVANLYEAAVAGTPPRLSGEFHQLTSGSGKDIPFQPVGRLLPFVGVTRSYDIWTIPLDANAGNTRGMPKRIAGGGINDWPSLALDGSRLIYVSTRYGQGQAGLGGVYSIVVRDLASGLESAIPVLSRPLISPDGRRIAFRGNGGIYIVPVTSLQQIGDPQLICSDCGRPYGFSPDGLKMVYRTPSGLGLLDLTTGEKTPLVEAGLNLTEARISPDGRWIVFEETAAGASRIWLARFRKSPIPRSDWHPITDGSGWDDRPRWSPNSHLLYFLSDRDGFRCIWAQRLESRAKGVFGLPFAVYHSHNSRSSLVNVNPVYAGLEVASDMVVFVNSETAGNVWLAHLPE